MYGQRHPSDTILDRYPLSLNLFNKTANCPTLLYVFDRWTPRFAAGIQKRTIFFKHYNAHSDITVDNW